MATDVTNRPFAGNWGPNLRRVIRHTPDALVYINGDTSVPGCASCGGRIDIQKFVTSVTCEPSTSPVATATINLSIPKYQSAGLFADGKFLLRPGLEIHIYVRGYFPAANLLGEATVTSDPEAMYPYYLVFHGVVTNNNYSYGGGEYTASLSCADLLHFWQYQRIVAQGSILANRPTGSKVTSSWMGHNLSGVSPYSIIYTLYRDVFGAAGGVETNWLGADATNAAAVSTQTGESLFSLSILYWQKRFSTTVANLRMFGANGKVYSAAQAAFIGSLTTEQTQELAKYYASPEAQSGTKDPSNALARKARAVGYDPFSVYTTGGGSSSESDAMGLNVAALQSYVSDVSKWGQINLLETEYLTKLEVANAVIKETGFEFYQDVDGDIVFKPPFYNMDTSGLRVYRIEPEDVISFESSEKEPEVTVIKWTGGHFSNLKVASIEGDFGKRAEYIDYRQVAQFGWRQETFDSAYYDNERSAYYSAISKMDIYNIAVKSGSVQIPIRPEIRPGYPVYVVHLDCYYYVTGASHSVAFGNQCTTTLTLVGRRAKFHAPGVPPADGRLPTVSDVRMDNMHLPPLPLTLPAGAVSSPSTYDTGDPTDPTRSTGFVNTYRKTQGFPNVVMAIDPQLVNPLQFARGFDLESLTTVDGINRLIRTVVMGANGVLQRDRSDTSTTDEKTKSFDGPWSIQMDNGEWQRLPSASELAAAARRLRDAGDALTSAIKQQRGLDVKADTKDIQAADDALSTANNDLTSAADEADKSFGVLVRAAQTVYERSFPGAGGTAAALELVSDFKSTYSVGKNIPGYYRYYSSAHPDPVNQGMLRFALRDGKPETTGEQYSVRTTATQFARDGTSLTTGEVTAGIPIAVAGGRMVVKPTHEIRSFDMARLDVTVSKGRVVQRGDRVQAYPQKDLSDALKSYFTEQIQDFDALSESTPINDFIDIFTAEQNRLVDIVGNPSAVPAPPDVPDTVAATPPASSGRGMFSISVLQSPGSPQYVTSPFSLEPRKVTLEDGTTKEAPHLGIDLAAVEGVTPVLAAAPGTVISYVGNRTRGNPKSGGGNNVSLQHDDGFVTEYLHLFSVDAKVQSQAKIRAGDVIGLAGATGGVTGPHLHFIIKLNGRSVDPSLYVQSGTSFALAGQATTPVVEPPPPVATPEGSADVVADTTTTSFNDDYVTPLMDALLPPGYRTLGDVPGNGIPAKVANLAAEMADALARPASEAMQRIAAAGATKDAGKYAAAWAEMIPEGYAVMPIVRSPDGRVVTNDASQAYFAPVYPVSDERGYEVVGTYPYGRGFSLSDTTGFGQLFGPTGELPNYDAVDTFIQKLISTGGTTAEVANAIGESGLNAAAKAELATTMSSDLLADPSVAEALGDAVPGVTGAGANTPASSAQGIGVFNPVNVAYGLSDMKVANTDACDCLSHQSDIQLLRDPSDVSSYIVLEGTEDAFAEYIREVSANTVPSWAASQENYRGYVVAVGAPTGLAGAVGSVQAAYDAAVSQVNAASAGFRRATDELVSDTAQAIDNLRGIDPVDAFIDPDSAFSSLVKGDLETAYARSADQASDVLDALKSGFTKGQS